MIKNIIFDLGNVLVDFDPEGLLKNLGFTKEKSKKIMEILFEAPIWQELDRGTYTYSQAHEIVGREYPEFQKDLELILERHIYECFQELSVPVCFLRGVKESGYKVYVLSNFNREGYLWVANRFDFFQLFDGQVISYEVESVKPEQKIYKTLLEKYHLNPEESLFLDDREENIAAGKEMGILGIVVKNPVQMMEDFMEQTGKEYFDIRDQEGKVTGQIKERSLVHKDGDIHGTSHVWIVKKNQETPSGYDLLLQERSKTKDSHPGC